MQMKDIAALSASTNRISIRSQLHRLLRMARRSMVGGILGLCGLCVLQLTVSGLSHSLSGSESRFSMLQFMAPVVHAQGFGQGGTRSDSREADAIVRRGAQRDSQTAQMQRSLAMQEVKRRFPGAHVLKLRPVGNSNVFRARVLTSNGKIKVVNVRAREF